MFVCLVYFLWLSLICEDRLVVGRTWNAGPGRKECCRFTAPWGPLGREREANRFTPSARCESICNAGMSLTDIGSGTTFSDRETGRECRTRPRSLLTSIGLYSKGRITLECRWPSGGKAEFALAFEVPTAHLAHRSTTAGSVRRIALPRLNRKLVEDIEVAYSPRAGWPVSSVRRIWKGRS